VSGDAPADPLTALAEAATATAELFRVHVEAGMPPQYVAVMLGQMMSAMAQAQPGE